MSISSCSGSDYTVREYQTAEIRSSFERAKGQFSDSGSFPVDPSGAMWYFLYKRTLETFCGGGTSIINGKTSTSLNSSTVVSAHHVDPLTGEVEQVNYELEGKDENDTINDIYSGRDTGSNGDSMDKKCWEIAEKTRQHSGDYSEWVKQRIGAAVLADVLSQIEDEIATYAAASCQHLQGRPASQTPMACRISNV